MYIYILHLQGWALSSDFQRRLVSWEVGKPKNGHSRGKAAFSKGEVKQQKELDVKHWKTFIKVYCLLVDDTRKLWISGKRIAGLKELKRAGGEF